MVANDERSLVGQRRWFRKTIMKWCVFFSNITKHSHVRLYKTAENTGIYNL